jgi:hypothetical protein
MLLQSIGIIASFLVTRLLVLAVLRAFRRIATPLRFLGRVLLGMLLGLIREISVAVRLEFVDVVLEVLALSINPLLMAIPEILASFSFGIFRVGIIRIELTADLVPNSDT